MVIVESFGYDNRFLPSYSRTVEQALKSHFWAAAPIGDEVL